MFIRWKRRQLRRNAGVALEAVLVQSVRVNGLPRQRLVRYLGSIRVHERWTAASVHAFWQGIDARLTALALDPVERQVLEQQLARVICPPTTMAPSLAGGSSEGVCSADAVASATARTMGTTLP